MQKPKCSVLPPSWTFQINYRDLESKERGNSSTPNERTVRLRMKLRIQEAYSKLSRQLKGERQLIVNSGKNNGDGTFFLVLSVFMLKCKTLSCEIAGKDGQFLSSLSGLI